MTFLILLLLKFGNVFASINWLVNQIRQWVEAYLLKSMCFILRYALGALTCKRMRCLCRRHPWKENLLATAALRETL